MAFENELPVGSVPFSNQLYKSPDGRIWTGEPFTPEYYRFLDPADLPYINIKDFGAVGDGVTDDTDAFDQAVSVAKAMEMALFIPTGKYPVTVTANNINMNGCLGITGPGTLSVTSTGNPDSPLLVWIGTKQPASGSVAVAAGQVSFTIDTGLGIKKGDTIFLVSNELLYSDIDTSTVRYVKGGRFTVDTYDDSTGALVTYEPSYYDITAGYFHWNDYRPRVQISDATIEIVGNMDKKGIEVRVGELYVNSAKINGFGRFGINSVSSFVRISDTNIYAEGITGTATGYSLQVSGLSDCIGSNSLFYGNRHAVACGDVPYWTESDAGGSTSSAIRLPSIAKVFGSRLEGSVYALDAHAGTTLLEAFNCDIYGGAIFGAFENFLNGCRVHQGNADMAVRFGRDRNLNTTNYASRHTVRNTEIYATTKVFGVYADLERVDINNVNVYMSASGSTRDLIDYNSGSAVRSWSVDGLNSYGNTGDDCSYLFRAITPLRIDNIKLLDAKVAVEVRLNTIRSITLARGYISTSVGDAFGINYFGGNKTFDVYMDGMVILDSPVGMRFRGARNISVTNSQLRGNTTSLIINQSAGAEIPTTLIGNLIDQASGDFISVEAGQGVPLVLIGNNFPASTSIDVDATVVGKYGNIGLDDKLKTALTSASTPKYGAASGSGDLTLS